MRGVMNNSKLLKIIKKSVSTPSIIEGMHIRIRFNLLDIIIKDSKILYITEEFAI